MVRSERLAKMPVVLDTDSVTAHVSRVTAVVFDVNSRVNISCNFELQMTVFRAC